MLKKSNGGGHAKACIKLLPDNNSTQKDISKMKDSKRHE